MVKSKLLDEKLSALYYPYADVRNPEALLHAALYFDEIFILQPNFFIPPKKSLHPTRNRVIPAYSTDTQVLIDEEIIKPIDQDFLGISSAWTPGFSNQVFDEENRKLLMASIIEDIRDPCLKKLTKNQGKLYWRFPNLQFIGLSALGLLFDVAKDLKGNIQITYWAEKRMRESLGQYRKFVDHQDSYESRLLFDQEMVSVPYIVGESLMINISLLACSRLKLVPFTDNVLHHDFLSKKIHSLLEDKNLRSTLNVDMIHRQCKAELLMKEVMNLELPRFKNIKAKDVIDIRKGHEEQLKRFRLHVKALSTLIGSSIWDERIQNDMGNIIDHDIKPSLLELKDSFRELKKRAGIQFVEKMATAAPLSLLTTVFIGLPVELALAAGVGISALSEALEYWRNKKALKYNGLSLLLT
jgi:hypothetical protein